MPASLHACITPWFLYALPRTVLTVLPPYRPCAQGLAKTGAVDLGAVVGWLHAAKIKGPSLKVLIHGFKVGSNDANVPNAKAEFSCSNSPKSLPADICV
jgi:hypothetical protein